MSSGGTYRGQFILVCTSSTEMGPFQLIILARDLEIDRKRKAEIAKSVGRWDFCAHDFSEEELVYAAACMLHHALEMEELEHWRISFGKSDNESHTRVLLTHV